MAACTPDVTCARINRGHLNQIWQSVRALRAAMAKWKGLELCRDPCRLVSIPWSKTQALGKEYIQSSPLLRLPGEIRECIYRATLGDRVLHVDRKEHSSDGWTIVTCRSDSLGENTYDGYTTDVTESGAPSSKDASMGQNLCEGCSPVAESGLGLQLLRTCRQIYDEASPMFWSTTTFAFKSFASFELWLDQRSGSRVRSIGRLQFNILSNSDEQKYDNGWREVLSMGRVQRLVGLRHLRLVIRQSMLSEAHQMMKSYGLTEPTLSTGPASFGFYSHDYVHHWSRRGHLQYLIDLKKLATLPLSRVTVSVRDSARASALHLMWSLEDRREYARAVRDALLDPEGALIYVRDIPRTITWSNMTNPGEAHAAEYLNIFERLQCGASNRYESQF